MCEYEKKKRPQGLRAKQYPVLILISVLCTMLFCGWLGAGQAQAAVAALNAWPSTATQTGTTGNPTAANFTVSAGNDRVLVVTVQMLNATAATVSSATYGGTALTMAVQNTGSYRGTWIGTLALGNSATATTQSLSVTITGTHSNVAVFAASYSGADQTGALITASSNTYGNNTAASYQLPAASAVNARGYGIYAFSANTTYSGNSDTPDATPYTNQNQLVATGWYAGVGDKSFASTTTTQPTMVFTATARASISLCTLNPAAGGGATQTLDTWTDDSANSAAPVTNLPMATIASAAGSGGVGLTATQVAVGGTVAAADVASVRVLWGATQAGIVNNPASLANINISLSGAGLSSANLVYQISLNSSAAGKTYSLTVNSVTGSTGGALTLPRTTATRTASAGTCTRNAPTVALSPTSANVTQGGNTTYNVTLTNNDTAACTGSSTFTLSAGDNNTTDFNASTLSAIVPSPCTIGPAGACTATLTVSAKAAGVVGNTDTTTVTSTDTANHNGLNGTGGATSTITPAGGGAQVPAGNAFLYGALAAGIVFFTAWNAGRGRRRSSH